MGLLLTVTSFLSFLDSIDKEVDYIETAICDVEPRWIRYARQLGDDHAHPLTSALRALRSDLRETIEQTDVREIDDTDRDPLLRNLLDCRRKLRVFLENFGTTPSERWRTFARLSPHCKDEAVLGKDSMRLEAAAAATRTSETIKALGMNSRATTSTGRLRTKDRTLRVADPEQADKGAAAADSPPDDIPAADSEPLVGKAPSDAGPVAIEPSHADNLESDEETASGSWLAAYQNALSMWLPQTCRWIFHTDQHRAWKNGESNLLWIRGDADQGKTIASTAVLWDLRQHFRNSHGHSLAYFYFDSRDPQNSTAEKMVRALISQLRSQRGNFVPDVYLRESQEETLESPLDVLLVVLRELVQDLDETYLVLDGLDHCPTQHALFFALSAIKAWGLDCLHILLTSRNETRTGRFLDLVFDDACIIQLGGSDTEKDMRLCIQAKLSRNPEAHLYGADGEVEEAVVKMAGGSFLVAHVLANAAGQRANPLSLIEALRQPFSLHEIFIRFLTSIREEQIEASVAALRWLIYTRALRTTRELLDYAVRMQLASEGQLLEHTQPISDLSTLLAFSTTRRGTTVVRLIHPSLKDFLTSEACRDSSAARFYMPPEACHTALGNSCLHHLLRLGPLAALATEPLDVTSLARYAAECWISHIEQGLASDEKVQERALQLFSEDSPAFYNWVRLYDHDSPQRDTDLARRTESMASPLYYASLLGLNEVALRLVPSAGDLAASRGCSTFPAPLVAAAAFGHVQVVETLLQTGALANADSAYFEGALQAAVAAGHEHIVRLLLDFGVDANSQAGFFGTALQAAAFVGDWSMLVLLLDHGADANADGGEYGSALQAAACKGNVLFARLLVGHKADPNTQGGHYGAPLVAAAFHGHSRIIVDLVQAGADVNAKPDGCGTALEAACLRGHLSDVRELLSKGADVHQASSKYGGPLCAAAAGGHDDIVAHLCINGASVYTSKREYGHALRAAAYYGHADTVRCLVQASAAVNSRGHVPVPDTALHAAAVRGHVRTVEVLLDAGANIKAVLEAREMALYAASYAGSLPVVRALLDRGTGLVGGRHLHALQAAAAGGHVDIAGHLLRAGTDVNAKGGEFGTALAAACHRGSTELVGLLIRRGADVNLQAGFYGTALKAAAFRGLEAVVKLLIEHGALVNATGGHFGHALAVASYRGNLGVVEQLLKAGADVNLRGGAYGNALSAAIWQNNDAVVDRLLGAGATSTESPVATNISRWLDDCQRGGQASTMTLTMRFETEIPVALHFQQQPLGKAELNNAHDVETRLANTVVIVRRHPPDSTVAEALPLRKYMARQWGSIGEEVLAALASAFASETCASSAYSHHMVGIGGGVGNTSGAGTKQAQKHPTASQLSPTPKRPLMRMPGPRLTERAEYAFRGSVLLVRVGRATIGGDLARTIEAIDFVCRAVRLPPRPNALDAVWLSTSSCHVHTIRFTKSPEGGSGEDKILIRSALSKTPVHDFQDQCWPPLFDACYVLDERQPDNRQQTVGRGLEMSFDLMAALAGAEHIVVVDGGVLLVGYQTVLVPTLLERDYAQFHLVFDREKQINPFLQSYAERVMVQDTAVFRAVPCFVGWCAEAQIKLGTRDMVQNGAAYSASKEKKRSLVLSGISVGVQAASAAPLQAGANAGASFSFVSHKLAFAPAAVFSKLLSDTAQGTVLVYDAEEKRSWLVPTLSLLLHMAHLWFLNREGMDKLPTDPIPFAAPHSQATMLKMLLAKKGNVDVCGDGEDGYTLRALMMGLSQNLLATVQKIKQSKAGELFGFEMMDVITEPARGAVMRAAKVKAGDAWLELANSVDTVIICSDLGEAIRPKSETGPPRNETCQSLPSKRDFMAAHLSCLLRIALRSGIGGDEAVVKTLLAGCGVPLHKDHALTIKGDPFAVCRHLESDTDSCWDREDMVQSLTHKSMFRVSPADSLRLPGLLSSPGALKRSTGALVFGPRTRHGR